MPTTADLRERRLELLRAKLRETLLDDGRDRLRPVIEPLLEEFDVLDIALAAIRLAESAGRGDGQDAEDGEIAPATLFDRPERSPGNARRPGNAQGPGVTRARERSARAARAAAAAASRARRAVSP